MRQAVLLFSLSIALFETGQGSTGTLPASDVRLIDCLNDSLQARFEAPPRAPAFGMNRVVVPQSLGRHFVPLFDATSDFQPENPAEKQVLAALEAAPLQVGFYVFGRAILNSPANPPNFRALKGPAANHQRRAEAVSVSHRCEPKPNVRRPSRLDCDLSARTARHEELQRRRQRLRNVARASPSSWRIAARPVLAGSEKCLACHGGPARVPLGQPLGGVLYVFRRAT